MSRFNDALVAATMELARANIPPDIQELLIDGDPMRTIAPGALEKAIHVAVAAHPLVQFVCDAQWAIPSEPAAQHACMEARALRASWLRALASLGISEAEAMERGRGLYLRAPLPTSEASQP